MIDSRSTPRFTRADVRTRFTVVGGVGEKDQVTKPVGMPSRSQPRSMRTKRSSQGFVGG